MSARIQPGSAGLLDIPFREYLEQRAIGSHLLAQALLSMEHYWKAEREPSADTPALLLGRAVHCLVLTPGLFDSEFAVVPVASRATKAFKEAANQDARSLLLESECEHAYVLADRVRTNPRARQLTGTENQREMSFFWTHNGHPCKGRADSLVRTDRGWVLVDLKTARNAIARRGPSGERSFADACADLQYPLQLAHYSEGIEAVTGTPIIGHMLVVVEKEPPYAVRTYELGEAWMEYGRAQAAKAWRAIEKGDCEERDILSLPVPGWLRTKEN